MPLACASVIGKMTRSLSSSSGRKITSTSSPWGLAVRPLTLGTDARRAVGSTVTLPSAPMVPDRNVSDEMWPSPTARRLENETTAVFRRAGLVGMSHDARIEQGGRFERVLVQKVGPDQAALRLVQDGMWLQRLFHLSGACLEDFQQVPVTAFEVFEHFGQLSRGSPGLEPKDPVDDMVGPGLIGRVEVSGFSRRFEGPDDDPGRIWAQIQSLAIQEPGLRHGGPLESLVVQSSDLRGRAPSWIRLSFGLSWQRA